MRTSIAAILLMLSAAASPAPAAELIMVDEPGCPWCAQWTREIGPIYPKTPESKVAPLRRIDISVREPAGFAYASRIVFTPTFVLIENGRELGRIEGYPGPDFFWGLLDKLLTENGIEWEVDS